MWAVVVVLRGDRDRVMLQFRTADSEATLKQLMNVGPFRELHCRFTESQQLFNKPIQPVYLFDNDGSVFLNLILRELHFIGTGADS